MGVKLAAILALALGIRLFAAVYVAPHPHRFIQSDAVGYDQIARNLVAGNGFSMRAGPPYKPDNFRTPGYPAIVATVYQIFGYRPEYVLFLQAFAGMLGCLFAFVIGTLIGNIKIGLLAATLTAINPLSITYASQLWSDVIFALLVAAATLMMILMLNRDRLGLVLLAGFTLGLATLVHPRSLLMVLLPTFFLIFTRFRSGFLRRGLVQAAAYVAIFMLTLSPWLLRNQATFGVMNLSSAVGTNVLYYGAALTEARRTGEDQWTIAQRLESEIVNRSREPLNEAEFASLALKRGAEMISDDPGTFAAVQLIGTSKVFLPGTLSVRSLFTGIDVPDGGSVYELLISSSLQQEAILEFLQATPAPVLFLVAVDSTLLVAMLAAWPFAVVHPQRVRIRSGILVSLVILYLALVAGPAGAPRFRVAFVPLLAVLAAGGFQTLIGKGRAFFRQTSLATAHLDQKPI